MPVSAQSPFIPSPSGNQPLRLAVLISGGGTTLINLQERIQQGELAAQMSLVVASRPCAGIDRAHERGLETHLLDRKSFSDVPSYSDSLFQICREKQVDLVVLAGFLTRIFIPEDYELRVMNIHPALIPAFCGQGMYGHFVHEAVIARGCQISGCTVHFCDNEYDNGPIITQRVVPVLADDSADELAARVFEQECIAYPEAIAWFAAGRLEVSGRRVRVRGA